MRFAFSQSVLPKNRWKIGLWVGLFTFALVLAGCDSDGSGMEEPSNTLTQVVSNNNDLSTLASALQAADLAETLGNENATFTVFAPANPAFDNVDVESLTNNPDLLRDLLNFHVVQGEVLTASNLEGRESVTTVEDQKLQIGSENGTLGAGLSLVNNPTTNTKELTAQSNNGAFSNGVPGQLQLRELTADQALVTVRLDPDGDGDFEDGPTQGSLQEATVSHPAHIYGSGGAIQAYLSPVDGSDPAARGSQIVPNDVLNSDGIYVNVHGSAANLQNIVSQGDVGSSGGNGGY